MKKQATWQAGAKRRQRAGCIAVAGGFMAVFTLLQLVVAASRDNADFGTVGNFGVGVVLGVSVFVLGIVKLSQNSR